MPNTRCRTVVRCGVCGKDFSLPNGEYKKKVRDNIGGLMYCSRACFCVHSRKVSA